MYKFVSGIIYTIVYTIVISTILIGIIKKNMGRVLVACEFSGIVREAFKLQGHDAWSCDFLDTEIPGQHYKCDVLNVLDKNWDLMIAHPTCTFITNSSVSRLYSKKQD